MKTTQDALKSFTEFVVQQTANERTTESKLPELFDLWMAQNPSDSDYAENVAAINASINDFMNGERGTTASVNSQDLRREFGITDE